MKWERQGNLSSHWTIGVSARWFPFALFVLAIGYLTLAHFVPLTEDELYYWAWSNVFSPSYYDHPPMVAYLIHFSTKIFGTSVLGIRLFGILISLAILAILAKLSDGRELLGFLLLTPMVLFGGLLMTPDAPFLFFWTLYVFWLTHLDTAFNEWSGDPVARVYRSSPIHYTRWLVGGVILGLGILSKYTMFLALPCTLIVLVSRYRFSAWSKGFLAHCLVALLFTLPILIFNYKNGFAPMKYQWNHAMDGGNPGHFWEFLGGQVLLLGALPFLMLPWLLVQLTEIRANFRLHVCLVFFIAPLAFILVQALRSQLEANWGMMCYISFWPLAQTLYSQTSFKPQAKLFAVICFAPAILASILLTIHLFYPLKFLAPEKDRVAKFKALYNLSDTITKDIRDNERTATVVTPNYQWASYLKFQGLPAEQSAIGKPSHFTVSPFEPCQKEELLALWDSPALPPAFNCFSERVLLREYPLIIRGKEMARFYLIELERE